MESTIAPVAEIREARSDEGPVLALVQEEASLAALGHIFPPERYPYPRAVVSARWAAAVGDPAKRTLIALNGDQPVGAACVYEEWLEGIYVSSEYWGTGLAGELHDRALEVVGGLGAGLRPLGGPEENARGRPFWERGGGGEAGRGGVVESPPYPLDIGYTLDFGR